MADDRSEFGTWAGLMVVILCGLGFGLSKCNDMQVRDICFRNGYADIRASIITGNYCVKRVDQTDVVVPLKEVESRR